MASQRLFTGTLGALKPKIDLRDYRLAVEKETFADQFQWDAPKEIKNQGTVNSCAANMASYVKEKLYQMKGAAYRRFSVGYIYGNKSDPASSGMYLRNAFQILNQQGDVYHTDFAYDLEVPAIQAKLKEAGTGRLNSLAAEHKIPTYFQVSGTSGIKTALQEYGYVGVGIPWYDDNTFGSYSNGKKTLTVIRKGSRYAGNHALTVYGWNPEGWLVANSWGEDWGDSGCSTLPYDYPVDEAWCAAVNPGEDVKMPAKGRWHRFVQKLFSRALNWLTRTSRFLFTGCPS